MGKYVIKRLFLLIPILLGVSFIIFTIMNMIPGDVASLVLGDNAPLSARQELTRDWKSRSGCAMWIMCGMRSTAISACPTGQGPLCLLRYSPDSPPP